MLWCFGAGALIYLAAGLPLLPMLLKTHADMQRMLQDGRVLTPDQIYGFALVQTICLSATVLGILSTLAWWTLKAKKPSARLWAILASISYLGASVIMVISESFLHRHGATGHAPAFFQIQVMQIVIGFGGLFAFLPEDSVREMEVKRNSPHIKGFGTSKVLDTIALVLMIVGIIALANVFIAWGWKKGLPVLRGWNDLALWIGAGLAATLLHEIGHALVGLAAGMKVRAFIIGPFEFRVTGNRWAFNFRIEQLLVLGGATGLVPVNPDESRWNEVAAIAAGPFASVLTGTVAAALAYSADGSSWRPYWEFFALYASFSLVGGLVNLLPMRPESCYSDGARILQLLRGGPAADFRRAASTVTATTVSSRRPKDYDIEAIERASLHIREGVQAILLRLWAEIHYIDVGSMEEARKALAEAERIYSESCCDLPAELHTAFVIDNLLLHHNAEGVHLWWKRMLKKKLGERNGDYWLAKSAFHWAEGNLAEAREALAVAKRYLDRMPDTGTYNYDRDIHAMMAKVLDGPPPERPRTAPEANATVPLPLTAIPTTGA